MKIGIISDVHAHLIPLEKALSIFELEQVDAIVCAGDLVEKGQDGDVVVALLQELNIPCVLGNHDEMIQGNQRWFRENLDPNNPNALKHLMSDDSLLF